MKNDNSKYYVVWKGRQTGIFDSWDACKEQVINYPAAEYLSFPSLEEAEQAFRGTYKEALERKKTPKIPNDCSPILDSVCVDASCMGNPGPMEYQCVETANRKRIFHEGPFEYGTNNIGEFLAIVQAMAWLKEKNLPYVIYTDSDVALEWIKKKRCNTKLDLRTKNEELWRLIRWAEEWLEKNEVSNPVLKWQTELWGENPADFNRK